MNNYIVTLKDNKEQYTVYNVDDLKEMLESYEFYSNGICIAIIPKDIVYMIASIGMEDVNKNKEDVNKNKKVNLQIYFKYQNNNKLLYDIFKNTVDAKIIDDIYTIYDEHGVLATIPMDSIVYIKRLTNN